MSIYEILIKIVIYLIKGCLPSKFIRAKVTTTFSQSDEVIVVMKCPVQVTHYSVRNVSTSCF